MLQLTDFSTDFPIAYFQYFIRFGRLHLGLCEHLWGKSPSTLEIGVCIYNISDPLGI